MKNRITEDLVITLNAFFFNKNILSTFWRNGNVIITINIIVQLLLISIPSYSQIDWHNNSIRENDKIIKCRMEFQDPGSAGANIIWDFSKIKEIDPEYQIIYRAPYLNDSIYILGKDTISATAINQGKLIVGIEHNTMYYYYQKKDSLLLLGYENPMTLMHFSEPVLIMVYPFNYMQCASKKYISEGIYSSTQKMATNGETNLFADAIGDILLPNGEIVKDVIRIYTQKTIHEEAISLCSPDLIKEEGLSVDSIFYMPFEDSHMMIESWVWYKKGYRYPVFESVKTTAYKKGIALNQFAGSYYYPLQEQYYGLSNDWDNQLIREKERSDIEKEISQETLISNSDKAIDENSFINYDLSMSGNDVLLNYSLSKDAELSIILFDIQGRQLTEVQKGIKQRGRYTQLISLDGLQSGKYVLRVKVDNIIYGETIVRK